MKTKTQRELVDCDFSSLIECYAPELRYNGRKYVGSCPFPEHKDKNPSFSITSSPGDPYNGVYVCSCSSGMMPKFLQEMTGKTFFQCMEIIRGKTNLGNTDKVDKIRKSFVKEFKRERKPFEKIKLVSGRERVVEYLTTKRNYSNETANKIKDEFKLCICDDIHRCDGWIIVPVYDADGKEVLMWLGQDFDTRSKHNGGDTEGVLFNLNRAKEKSWVIVVESVWCAIRLWSYGMPAVSTFGARLDDEQAKLLEKYFVDIYLCYGEDKAGLKAREIAIKKLTPQRNISILEGMVVDADKTDQGLMMEILGCARRI